VKCLIKLDIKQYTAKTAELAYENALNEYKVPKEELSFTVIQEAAKTGFLGLKTIPAIIEVYLNENYLLANLQDFLNIILDKFEGTFYSNLKIFGKTIVVSLEGEGLEKLIGKYGRTLGALQHLLMIYVNRMTDTKIDVKLDIGEYRKNRKKHIEEIADSTARKAIREGSIELAPMFSFERKIIHEYIRKNFPQLETKSVGLEPYRKVVVYAKELQATGSKKR